MCIFVPYNSPLICFTYQQFALQDPTHVVSRAHLQPQAPVRKDQGDHTRPQTRPDPDQGLGAGLGCPEAIPLGPLLVQAKPHGEHLEGAIRPKLSDVCIGTTYFPAYEFKEFLGYQRLGKNHKHGPLITDMGTNIIVLFL